MNKPHKFVLNLSQTLDFGSSNKRVALQNLSVYNIKNFIRKLYKNNKLNSQMHRKDKYSEHSSIIWPVWPNGWVFV